MTQKNLVTGCSGFVGSELIKYLDKKKYKTICVSRNIEDKSTIPFNNKDKIKKAIRNSDVIIHLAASVNPFDKKIWKINVDYTKLLVDEAKKYNKRFIFLSTHNVLFGKDNYSETKRQAEKIVRVLKNFVILRPTIVYGIGDKYIGRLSKIVKTYPVVPIIGNGKNLLQPIYLGDLIKIIECCINKNIKGTFLVAGKSIVSYNDLVNSIIKKLKLKRIKVHIPICVIRPFSYLLQKLLKNPPVTTVQLDNLKIDMVYNVKNIEKTFHIRLSGIEEGVDILLKNA